MISKSSYDVQASHRDANAEIQRLAAQARLGWDKESRTLSWFGLQDGMTLLEPGSGPGFITEALLTLWPSSRITCLEIDLTLLKKAEQFLQDKARGRVQFVEGSVMATQLPGDSFDFAYARLLFQHLPDPVGAAREIKRILKPGGKLVIYDIDDEIFGIIDPPVPEYAGVLEKFGQAQSLMGGNRRVGRNLWRILIAAGFINLSLEVIATHTDALGMEPFLPMIDADRLLPFVKMGLMTEQEVEKVREARQKFLESPKPYILLLMLMVSGEKPH